MMVDNGYISKFFNGSDPKNRSQAFPTEPFHLIHLNFYPIYIKGFSHHCQGLETFPSPGLCDALHLTMHLCHA